VKRRFAPQQLQRPYHRKHIAVVLDYGMEVTLRLATPEKLAPEVEELLRPLIGRPIENVSDLLRRLKKLEALDCAYHVYPDAEQFIEDRLFERRIRRTVAAIRNDPAAHPLRTTLLKTPLLPYQLDGVAFAVGAGRAVLADDMGLGKTIQGVGVAEILAREAGISKVLVICPASLKSQWRNEIHRFCDRDVQLITGRT